jgi:predicted metal-dependent phosphotriesterase family hydrolase
MRDVELMAEELATAKRDGVACIVDGGHPDMGRDLDFVRQASMKSGLPSSRARVLLAAVLPERDLDDERVADRRGVDQAGRRSPAGAFGEIGSWDEMTADERKVFRAVGKAHVATGLPIFTHTGSRQSRDRAARHPRGRRRESQSRDIGHLGTSSMRTSTCTKRSAGAVPSSRSIVRVATATYSRCRS